MKLQSANNEMIAPRANICWICNTHEANSREHKTKRSDLAAVFDSPTQNRPLFFNDLQRHNKPVGSFDAKTLKATIQICNHCNSTRTQAHDHAWEHLSDQLRNRSLIAGQSIPTNRLFSYDTRQQMLNVHLFFVKLFGCMLHEADANGMDLPISIRPFSEAIMSGRPHPEVYIEFGKHDGTVGRSDLKCWKTEHGSVLAGWLYELRNIAVSVMFAQTGRWEHLPSRWHPHSPTDSKRLWIADFMYASRASAEGERSLGG